MERVAVLLCAIAPGVGLIRYGLLKTRGSGAGEALWEAFALGAVAAIATSLCELMLMHLLLSPKVAPLPHAAIEAVFIAAIPEETVKFAVLIGIALRHVDVRRAQDVIMVALAVSVGFATLENIAYVAAPGDWKLVAFTRAITAVPSHGLNGMAMGAFATLARLRPQHSIRWLALALVVPAAMHALYDFPLMLAAYQPLVSGLAKVLWLYLLVVTALPTLYLGNRALAAAAAFDRLTGPPGEAAPAPNAWRPRLEGVLLLFLAPLVLGVVLRIKGAVEYWQVLVMCLLPILLAVDLLCAGWRRVEPAADIPLRRPDGLTQPHAMP